jgi:hypothetical protein
MRIKQCCMSLLDFLKLINVGNDELLYGDTDTSVFSGAMDTSQSEAKRYHPLRE